MSSPVKAAIIVAAAILAAVCIYIYFSPYQSCVRSLGGGEQAQFTCARNSN